MGLLDDAIREHLELKRRRGADAGDISREESEALGPVRRGPDGAPDLSDTFVPGQAAAEPPPPAGPPSDSDPTSILAATPPPADVAPPARAPSPEPPSGGYEPPAAPPYEPPAPPPPAQPERPWFERTGQEPEPTGFERDPEPEAGADHPSLLSRFRVGRKLKHEPPPAAVEPPSSYDPPPLPSSRETAYEPPPPTPPPTRGYEPSPAQHEPDIVPADEEPDVEDVLEETPDFLEETPEHDRLWFEQRPPRDFDFDG